MNIPIGYECFTSVWVNPCDRKENYGNLAYKNSDDVTFGKFREILYHLFNEPCLIDILCQYHYEYIIATFNTKCGHAKCSHFDIKICVNEKILDRYAFSDINNNGIFIDHMDNIIKFFDYTKTMGKIGRLKIKYDKTIGTYIVIKEIVTPINPLDDKKFYKFKSEELQKMIECLYNQIV